MGVFIQAFMVGIVFAKLARPIKRAQTLLFSRNAIICHRDGIPCLMFRVGDMRKSHIIEAHVRAQIIRKKVSINKYTLSISILRRNHIYARHFNYFHNLYKEINIICSRNFIVNLFDIMFVECVYMVRAYFRVCDKLYVRDAD